MKNVLLTLLVCLFTYAGFAQCAAGFTYTTSGLTATFTNTSTPTGPSSAYYLVKTIKFSSSPVSFWTPVSHTFPAPGTYSVIASLKVYDSLTNALLCSDLDTQQITINYAPCAVTISAAPSGNTVVFTANNLGGTPGMTYNWDFGDFTTGTGSPVTHTYSTYGYHHITLTASSATASCSVTDSTVISVFPNVIQGEIIADSLSIDTFKVWLIQYDSSTHLLWAVDSVITYNGVGWMPYALYKFNNHPVGEYRTKAAQLDGPTSGTGYIPTYHINSLYWSSATSFIHTGSTTPAKDIYMQVGTVTGGPGFIGGNVTMGANKGTSAGIEGMLVFLKDNGGSVVKHAYTDANGDYSFDNLATGIYTVYPEDMNYTTTAATILLAPGQTSNTGVNFEKSEGKMTISPKATAINDVAGTNLFSISPNPSNGKVFITWTTGTKCDADITITDIIGRKVFKSIVNTGSKTELNLSHLQAGQYFISVHTGKETAAKQVLIQK